MALVLTDVSEIYKSVIGLRKADLESLMKWCKVQPYLPEVTETQIINFLHASRYINEAAKRHIDDFYTARTHCPEFFANRNPRDLNLKCFMYFPFEQRTPESCQVFFGRLIDHNPDSWNFSNHIKLFDMSTMLVLNRDGPSNGVVYIHDLTGMSFTHLTKINLMGLKKVLFYLQECMPIKIQALHFINIGNFMDKILSMVKPFMKNDLFNVLHVHPTMESIYKMIPKESFPNDFPGGCAPSIEEQQNKYTECLLKHAAYFHAEEKQVIDEKRRPGKPKNAGDLFGIEGTFKKLDID